MRSNFVAILDANVLYPAPLRDLLIQLGKKGLYRARWSNEITHEWIQGVLRDRKDLRQEQLMSTAQLMEEAIPGAIISGFAPIVQGLSLPDRKDRHVLAAAIKCSAQVIVTYNLKDFPKEVLNKYDIEVKHPDEFLQDTFDVAPSAFISQVKRILRRLKNPPVNPQELIEIYRNKHQLTIIASTLEEELDLLE